MTEQMDVLIVGAGISGLGAAVHLQKHCPGHRFLILEARTAIGGTWDLFRYPGIRSDSDMYTLGYNFKPWTGDKVIASGDTILGYLEEAAREYDLYRRIYFGHQVVAAAWDSASALWTVSVRHAGEEQSFSCKFLYLCCGYYDYANAHMPAFPEQECFRGPIVCPQHWPEGLDCQGKRVVVIGSGAAAMTLVPSLASEAAEVVMLQRSPTYVVSLPSEDPLANRLRCWLPPMWVYRLIRWRNVLRQMFYFRLAKSRPERFRRVLLARVREELGPNYAVDRHFSPDYKPWEQRLCVVPDSDLFKAIRAGRARMVTGQIERFSEAGIVLQSGETLAADIIVSATGLKLLFLAGIRFSVDARPVDFSSTFAYKGLMFSGVPNLALASGYTNASWTLKADLLSEYVCRLLNHLQASGTSIVTPVAAADIQPEPWSNLTSGYLRRARDSFPKQGSRLPWKLHQNYARDLLLLRYSRLDDGVLHFTPVAR